MAEEYASDDMVLEEVSKDKLGDVVEAMKQYLPHSIHVQSSVSMMKHYSLHTLLNRKVFTPRHADYRDKMVVVTPLITKKNLQSLQVFWSFYELEEDAVYRLLQTLSDFSWTEPFLVRLCPEHLHLQFSRLVSRLSSGHVCLQENTAVYVYIFEGPVPHPPNLGPNYLMGTIERPDFGRVLSNTVTSAAYEDPQVMDTVFGILPSVGIHQVLQRGQSTGITDADSLANVAEDTARHQGRALVSWCTVKPAGDVGTTFTEEHHRGKKLARAAMLAAMKHVEDLGTNPYSNSATTNGTAHKMLESTGFQRKFVSYVTLYF